MNVLRGLQMALLLMVTQSCRADWSLVSISPFGVQSSIDLTRAEFVRPSVIKAWVKVDASLAEKKPGYHRALMRYLIDCSAQNYQILASVKYNQDGETIESETFSDLKWYPIVPESVFEEVSSKLCQAIGLLERASRLSPKDTKPTSK